MTEPATAAGREHDLTGNCWCAEIGATFADTPCGKCGHWIGWVDCPTGGWWAHYKHPDDGHDAVPVVVRRLQEAPEWTI